MKLTTVLLTATLLFVQVYSLAQETTINTKEQNLDKVLININKEGGFMLYTSMTAYEIGCSLHNELMAQSAIANGITDMVMYEKLKFLLGAAVYMRSMSITNITNKTGEFKLQNAAGISILKIRQVYSEFYEVKDNWPGSIYTIKIIIIKQVIILIERFDEDTNVLEKRYAIENMTAITNQGDDTIRQLKGIVASSIFCLITLGFFWFLVHCRQYPHVWTGKRTNSFTYTVHFFANMFGLVIWIYFIKSRYEVEQLIITMLNLFWDYIRHIL